MERSVARQRLPYYAVLGVAPGVSAAEIRFAYLRLAMMWHPDRRGRDPRLAEESKCRFQQIQEAYQVLSDERRRVLYDSAIYDPDNDDEGLHDFLQEMFSIMANVRREEPVYSLDDLQSMLDEMIHNFGASQPKHSLFTGGLESRSPQTHGNAADQHDSASHTGCLAWKAL